MDGQKKGPKTIKSMGFGTIMGVAQSKGLGLRNTCKKKLSVLQGDEKRGAWVGFYNVKLEKRGNILGGLPGGTLQRRSMNRWQQKQKKEGSRWEGWAHDKVKGGAAPETTY